MTVDYVPSGASEQCEYEKPHPSHHWWRGKAGVDAADYRRCGGLKDPNAPDWGEGGLLTHSKQALGEYEVWLRGTTQAPHGARHLHFLYDQRGRWECG